MAGVDAFSNHLPVRIRFGAGVSAELGAVLSADGARRPFLLIDGGLDGIPGVAAAIADVPWAGRYTKTAGEPSDAQVDEAAAALDAADADAVVAIGGGSVMDTAKAARLVAQQGGGYLRFAAGGVAYEPPTRPLVLIPTTAGTGSEVSGGAVITNAATHIKAGIASPCLRAQHALVDPALTYGLPPAQTRDAGVDALAQAIAGVVVRARTPIGDGIGLEAVRLAASSLAAVCRDGSDHAARERMMCASLLGGLVMNISDCGSEHSVAQALGGRYGLPHGLTIGLVLAETMDFDRRTVPGRFERVADALGEPDDGSSDGSRAVHGVRRILAAVAFPTMREVGVEPADFPALAVNALADYFISVAPAPWSQADVVACYEGAYAVESRSSQVTSR